MYHAGCSTLKKKLGYGKFLPDVIWKVVLGWRGKYENLFETQWVPKLGVKRLGF
jgi:hypothetical protein